MLRKYFLAKLFVPLIKGSVSPQLYVIFGKLNFWRNIDRRGPYKMVKIWTISICAKKFFFGKIICSTHQRKCFSTILRNFLENWIFEGISTGADLTKMVKICIILICAKKIFFWQNYLFDSSKEVFLHNFTQFLEKWIFEGISTGADLTKMVKIWTIWNWAKKLFCGKIICSTHQKKCFSTILRNFWKIEFLKEYRQARTLQKWWKFELS